MNKLILISSLLFLAGGSALKLNSNATKVMIEGTSTLHDWEMSCGNIQTQGSFTFANGSYQSNGFKLIFPVKDLKSGKSMMDDNTQDALEVKKYPNVIYELLEVYEKDGKTYSKGKLSIHGETKVVNVPLNVQHAGTSHTITGSTSFKMSSYGVEPPTVMFGSISTGDVVTIKFSIVFNSQN